MHGGAPGSGAPIGNRNALKHGRYTAAAISRRKALRELIRKAAKTLEEIESSAVQAYAGTVFWRADELDPGSFQRNLQLLKRRGMTRRHMVVLLKAHDRP